jgi:hypothetical protein
VAEIMKLREDLKREEENAAGGIIGANNDKSGD